MNDRELKKISRSLEELSKDVKRIADVLDGEEREEEVKVDRAEISE